MELAPDSLLKIEEYVNLLKSYTSQERELNEEEEALPLGKSTWHIFYAVSHQFSLSMFIFFSNPEDGNDFQ
jgi:hypothetical protein